jgi:hypothetical protein
VVSDITAAEDLAGRVIAPDLLELTGDLRDPGQRRGRIAEGDAERAVVLANAHLACIETSLLERGAEVVGGVGDIGGHMQNGIAQQVPVLRAPNIATSLRWFLGSSPTCGARITILAR